MPIRLEKEQFLSSEAPFLPFSSLPSSLLAREHNVICLLLWKKWRLLLISGNRAFGENEWNFDEAKLTQTWCQAVATFMHTQTVAVFPVLLEM